MNEQKIYEKIRHLLDEVPGQSIKELAAKLDGNRTFTSGYLRAMEELGYVNSRNVGPARVYYNETGETVNETRHTAKGR